MDDARNLSGQDGRYPMKRCNRRNRNAAAPSVMDGQRVLCHYRFVKALGTHRSVMKIEQEARRR